MRVALRLTACLLLAALAAAQPSQLPAEPFVRVAVSYPSGLSRDRERSAVDLEAIHTLGFNSIRVPIEWADTEPARGQYRFDALDTTFQLAGHAGLNVVLLVDTAALPEWLVRRYPDGRFVPASASDGPRAARACLDHPGVRADIEAYVAAASARAARYPAFQAVDIRGEVETDFCVCPHTERRFRQWLTATFGAGERPAAFAASDRAAFVALERRDHLALVAGATAVARGARVSSSWASAPSVIRHLIHPTGAPPAAQDDWLMTTVVDRYGTLVPPALDRAAAIPPAQLALALDGMRSAARGAGWLMTENTGAGGSVQVPSAGDLRLWTWAAVSRGARAVTFGDWRASGSGASGGLVSVDGTISDRARAAGALARVIGRNPALFARLRPRAAKVAIVYDPRPSTGSGPAFLSNVYRTLFERNIQVDFIHLDEVAAGAASRYQMVFAGALSTLPRSAGERLKAYVAAGGTLVDGLAMSPTDQQVVALAARAGVVTEVRLEGATGPVEVRFLESSDVLMLVGLNHADSPQRVKMTFTPDTQEAIWQNMETGAAVNFIAGPEGPAYTYSFQPSDALILMIRKHLR